MPQCKYPQPCCCKALFFQQIAAGVDVSKDTPSIDEWYTMFQELLALANHPSIHRTGQSSGYNTGDGMTTDGDDDDMIDFEEDL